MSKSIFFDGLNLSLTRGTGIATYTRCLEQLTRQLGHKSGVLYSRLSRFPREELLQEVSFFDADTSSSAPGWVQSAVEFVASGLFGVRPQKVPVTGAVVTRPLGNAFVPSNEVHTAFRVFDHSSVVFGLSGQFLKVNFPERPDLFHWTYPMPVRSNARANIYTIHDLVPLRLPYASLDRKAYHYRMLKKIAAKADHIVTVSEYSKQDIMKYLGVEESRITNTYAATDIPGHYAALSDDSVATELANTFGLDMRKYLLFYGSLEPKKNIGRIVQAYLSAQIRIPLVVVFAQSWLVENETQLLNQLLVPANQKSFGSQKRIQRYEYLPFRLLATLIRGARAVVFPSLYEGFGLPILEGMMMGTPVITSTAASTPEVAGDAAILVDPHNVDAIRDAMVKISNDDGLCADLSRRGIKRAEFFAFDGYRERVGKMYAALT